MSFRASNRAVAITRFGGPGDRARTSAAARVIPCRGHWSIAQLLERLAHIEEVGGSTPSGPTCVHNLEGSPIGRGHRLENGSRRRVGMSVRLALPPLRRGTQVWFKGPGCYPGRSAQVRRRKGPNPFLSSTAAWCKTVARRAVTSVSPGSNPGAAASGL